MFSIYDSVNVYWIIYAYLSSIVIQKLTNLEPSFKCKIIEYSSPSTYAIIVFPKNIA
jgi:hypothetical protein